MPINQRIADFIKKINTNPTALGNKIGISQSSMKKIVTGDNLPSAKILIPLKEHFPLLNMNWVLVGEGDMFLTETGNAKEIIEAKNKMIQLLEKNLEDLRRTIDQE